MSGITHRAVRALWLVLIMLSSATCFIFTLSVHQFFGRPSDICILAIPPAITMIAATVALFANYLFKSSAVKCVAMELLWVGSSSPLALIMGLYTYAIIPAPEHPEVVWPIYVARILAWELATTVTLYLIGILSLALLTSSLFDKDVWLRPIAGSPSPFPLALMWHVLRHQEPTGGNEKEMRVCPPGCACARKLENAEMDSGLAHTGPGENTESRETERVPGIRVPNIVERSSFIAVGLMMYEGEAHTDV